MALFSRPVYLYNRIFNSSWVDFVSGGLGLDYRANRFEAYWSYHHQRSQQAVLEGVKDGGHEVVILGAGRLRDLSIGEIVERFNRVVLVDADPRVICWLKRKLRHFGPRIILEHADFTGAFLEWTVQLKKAKSAQVNEITEILDGLFPPTQNWTDDTVISLNVLSQLGVMWRDRVFSCLGYSCKASDNVQRSIAQSIRRLEERHIQGLKKAISAVLVADRYFITAANNFLNWEIEDALYGEWPETLNNKRVEMIHSWLWEIVPLGGEKRGEAIFHEVWARAYRG